MNPTKENNPGANNNNPTKHIDLYTEITLPQNYQSITTKDVYINFLEATNQYIVVHGRQGDIDLAYEFERIEAQKGGNSSITGIESSSRDGRWLNVNYGSGQTVQVQFFKNITGTNSGNNIQGNDSAPGTPGGDEAFNGEDVINGLDGNDTLDGGGGDDVLSGGADGDVFGNDGGIDRIVDFAAGEQVFLNGNLLNNQTLNEDADNRGTYKDSHGNIFRWFGNSLEIRHGMDDGYNLKASAADLNLTLVPYSSEDPDGPPGIDFVRWAGYFAEHTIAQAA